MAKTQPRHQHICTDGVDATIIDPTLIFSIEIDTSELCSNKLPKKQYLSFCALDNGDASTLLLKMLMFETVFETS